MDLGFLVLNPNGKLIDLKNTVWQINLHCYDRKCICVVDINTKNIENMNQICPTYRSKKSIIDLVNCGMKKMNHEWTFMIMAGSKVTQQLETNINTFCNSEKDVLFPIVNKKHNFTETDFNGVLINTNFFKKVGNFTKHTEEKDCINDVESARIIWTNEALCLGAKFKAIARIGVV